MTVRGHSGQRYSRVDNSALFSLWERQRAADRAKWYQRVYRWLVSEGLPDYIMDELTPRLALGVALAVDGAPWHTFPKDVGEYLAQLRVLAIAAEEDERADIMGRARGWWR